MDTLEGTAAAEVNTIWSDWLHDPIVILQFWRLSVPATAHYMYKLIHHCHSHHNVDGVNGMTAYTKPHRQSSKTMPAV